ncbi:hypothetical protein K437DRAFT_246930 [Tilletiaria anomala UBC 951]|uniref:HIG1 domain-containing protein n=1 Tax=Tilletiaria anomala (strain ATCC 24038 / CBS 436.72 / UBC 951) TaxID=1037660 RepID=A0A066W4M6_TILAU|nr:uncharacterized protein K437DRAFT_246930 [Tilletiaria anomala UBC 951]KDN45730.1 hypothetical protein K437DRAFT_246930 [Tilletiaria anomala UBC 951]
MTTFTSELGSAPLRRRRREEEIESAYEVQRAAAIKGALIWTGIGASSCFFAHNLFPGFRRQTLALKAFLTSGATIFGFVVGADTKLLSHESQQRARESRIRQMACSELGRKGIVASEAEIEKWKDTLRQEYLDKQAKQQDAVDRVAHQAVPEMVSTSHT